MMFILVILTTLKWTTTVTQLVESGSMGISRACIDVGIGRTAYYSHIKVS